MVELAKRTTATLSKSELTEAITQFLLSKNLISSAATPSLTINVTRPDLSQATDTTSVMTVDWESQV